MIVGHIIGGLGNQMFQYVFYKYLALNKKTNLGLDLSSFTNYGLHNGYELEKVFGIDEEIVSSDIKQSYKPKYKFLTKLEKKLFSKNYIFNTKYFKEKNFLIDDRIFNEKVNDFYAMGYFQTYQYIEVIENEFKIKNLYKFNTTLTEEENTLLNNNCIAIHIRGGDYLTNEKDRKLFGNICTVDYYKKAISYIKQNVKNPKFLIFTNDIDYAKTIIDGEQFKIIDWNNGKDSFRDMYLMSLCNHNIIANSSFSWWGAWLNANSAKIVIAPNRWFNSSKISQGNIIPSNWIKISNDGIIFEDNLNV